MALNPLLAELTKKDVMIALAWLFDQATNEQSGKTTFITYNGTKYGIKTVSYIAIAIKNEWDISKSYTRDLNSELISRIRDEVGYYYHTHHVKTHFKSLGLSDMMVV